MLQRAVSSTALVWHPTRKVLACGWLNGEVLLWNETDKEMYQTPNLHRHEITALCWSSSGTRLLSADSAGQVAIWKADSRGRLQQTPVCDHLLQEPLVEVALRPSPPVDPNK